MKFSEFSKPIEKITNTLARVRTIACEYSLADYNVSRISKADEIEIVHKSMADNLAYEMLKSEIIDRTITKSSDPDSSFMVNYMAKFVVMSVSDLNEIKNLVGYLAREERFRSESVMTIKQPLSRLPP
jgi:hypothetical protein